MMYYAFKYDDGCGGLMVLSEERIIEKYGLDSLSVPCRLFDIHNQGAFVRHIEFGDLTELTNHNNGVLTMKKIVSAMNERISRMDSNDDWCYQLVDYFENSQDWQKSLFDLQDEIWDFEDGNMSKFDWGNVQ